MSIRKAVIPAAGWGTRFLPISKTVPKEALPLVDRPVIQYAIEEAAASGVDHVILVSSQNKKAVEDYFDRNFELEAVLERKGDERRLEELRRLASLVELSTVRQQEQLGLGHAVLTAKNLVGGEPFAVILPDDVILAETPALKQLMGVYERHGASAVTVHEVAGGDVSRWGIIAGEPVGGRTHRLSRLVEKPKPEDAPSRLAIIGRYIFTPEIFDKLEGAEPGAIGEIQLTDGMNALARDQGLYALEYEGQYLDAGTPLGLIKASVTEALLRQDMGPELKRWLREQI